MRRVLVLALVLSLAACAGGPRGRGEFRGGGLRPVAEPGELVAAELAFARAAQDEGQWTAFDQFAADDAVMFAPQPVLARSWLKGRANPPKPVTWQPYQVWSSCDGTLAVTKGPWQRPDGSFGYFTTIWERQADNKNNDKLGTDYRWLLDMGDTLKVPLQEPELVQADVADCPARRAGRRFDRSPDDDRKHREWPKATTSGTLDNRSGKSADGTLAWSENYAADGTLTVSVSLAKDGAMKEVVHNRVTP